MQKNKITEKESGLHPDWW